MGDRMSRIGRCPICNSEVHPDHRPFCSKRCAQIDLHRWLSEQYAVPGSTVDADEAIDEAGG